MSVRPAECLGFPVAMIPLGNWTTLRCSFVNFTRVPHTCFAWANVDSIFFNPCFTGLPECQTLTMTCENDWKSLGNFIAQGLVHMYVHVIWDTNGGQWVKETACMWSRRTIHCTWDIGLRHLLKFHLFAFLFVIQFDWLPIHWWKSCIQPSVLYQAFHHGILDSWRMIMLVTLLYTPWLLADLLKHVVQKLTTTSGLLWVDAIK